MGFSTQDGGNQGARKSFQSLEGIFGFFNKSRNIYRNHSHEVSIPRRDFWVFQPEQ
ncbi:hypothetical protein CKA32_000674 [Geitlerinema sp. FC II]|nr:hypothetical protein CKA32_000674 [Geitlerinema sp. FC II]